MINFIDEKGKQHSALVECKRKKGINGEKSLEGTIYTNEKILEGIGRGWRLQFQGEMYCLTFVHPIDEGNRIVVEFDAVHEFFFDFSKSVVYRELNGSNTMTAYLDFIFSGSGYDYRLEVDVNAFEKQNFGMKNRLTLFKDIISSTGLEFSVNGKVVRILQEVGTDLSTIVKKGFNLNQLNIEKDAGSFITYKRGYGAYFDEDDHSKGRLTVEYLSPLAEIYGKLEGEPIIDERYKVEDNLRTRLQKDVEESYGISAEIDMEDLTKAGYSYEQPHEGDYIMAINDDLGFRQKIRIMSYVTEFDTEENIIKHDVSCGSANLVSKISNSENDFKDQIQSDLENAVNNANSALIAANGKNKVFEGPDEPTATAVGDIWYHVDGEQTIMKYWNGYEWVPFINPDQIREQIIEAEKGVTEAKQSANDAVNQANQAAAEAGFANNAAQTAVEQSANAVSQASNASIAAQEAKQNSANAVDAANQAKGNADTALGKADSAISTAQDALNQSALAKSQAEDAINKYLGMGMSPAWSWSADGTDRFTKVYPRENLQTGSNTEFILENEAGDGSQKTLPFSILSDDIIGKKVILSVEVEGRNMTNRTGTSRIGYELFTPLTDGKTTWFGVWQIVNNISNLSAKRTELAIDVPTNLTPNKLLNGKLYIQVNGEYIRAAYPKFEVVEDDGTKSTIYTPAPSEDYANAVPSYIGFSIEPSNNPADYTWMRNPEKVEGEVKVELTEINGELSRKASQESFNQLNGTVTNQSTLISQNQKDIKAKADKTLVDTINKTVTDNSAAIGVNATAITQKANQTSVDTLTGRVTTAEGSITTIAGQVDLKANKTDVNALSNTVTSLSGELSVQAGKITALTTKTDGHSTQIGSLESSYSGLNSTVATVKQDLEGLEIGQRNWQSDTRQPLVLKGSNSLNQCLYPYKFTFGALKDNPFKLNQTYHVIFDWEVAGNNVSGGFFIQHNNPPYSIGSDKVTITEQNRKGTYVFKGSMNPSFYEPTAIATSLGIRADNLVGTLVCTNWRYVVSDKATDWTPAPEDMATVTEMSNLTQTVNTIQSTVADKANQSQVTQLANQITSVVSDISAIDKTLNWQKLSVSQDFNLLKTTGRFFIAAIGNTNAPLADRLCYLTVDNTNGRIKQEYQDDYDVTGKYFRISSDAGSTWKPWQRVANQSQITQLATDINLRVQKGELISQINLQAGQTLIQTGKLYLDAATVQFSGQAFIPSASIVNLSADKINTGTLNAGIVNVTNMNANNITTGTLNANRIGSKTITADKINVTSLSAIVANLGTVTAGTLNSVNINAAVMNGGEIISPLFKFPSMTYTTPNSSYGDTFSKGKITPKGFFMVSETFHSIDGQLEYIDMLTITSSSVTVEQWSATNNQTKRSAYGFSGTAHTTTYSGKPTNYTYAINMTA